IEHDKMMAVVQGLTHFDFFVFGETIKRLKVDIETSLNFVSPVYKLMISSVARYMNQNPKLYSDIQMYNKENLKVHETFMQVSRDFNKYVEQEDEVSFIKTIEGTQKYFGDNAHKGQVYTDKIIFLLSKQVEQIKKNIGKKCSFENIYTGEVKEQVIKKYEEEIICLESGEELLLDEWRVF
ncbi:prephenate dehydrogenase/arogenate dehydrogenase family protein, partial [Candidatus Gracilibacteria bacterium]|nr:prephenate dehydrogenase/arogenate dehydrogenase family protein [Candidatus Gracilibacteria bacterium]